MENVNNNNNEVLNLEEKSIENNSGKSNNISLLDKTNSPKSIKNSPSASIKFDFNAESSKDLKLKIKEIQKKL